MGYTHYWRVKEKIPRETWLQICDDAEKIIAACHVKLVWESDEPKKKPEVKRELDKDGAGVIRFNGIGEDGHETFFFEANASGFNFCKTASKPYDVAVCAMLAAIADRAPMIKVTSDGTHDEWREGLYLAKKALNREISVDLKRQPPA